jgi:hypothetical protein
MARGLPPSSVPDWHAVVRLSVYPTRAKLAVVEYRLIGSPSKGSTALVAPRDLERPRDMWEVVQGLALGVDLLSGKWYS